MVLTFSKFFTEHTCPQGDGGEHGYDGQRGAVGDIGSPGIWDPTQMDFYAGPPGIQLGLGLGRTCNV